MNPVGVVLTHTREGFSFVTKHSFASGEFVCYRLGGDRVLARVRHTEPLRDYPVEFLLDPEVDAGDVAVFYGLDASDYQFYRVHARVVGYFDRIVNEFINPRVMPLSGTRIERVDDTILSDVNRVSASEVGSAHIGTILGTKTDAVLSVREMVSQHLSIIAATGAGKSYTVGVIVEELISAKNMASVLIFDPHGEYGVLSDIQNDHSFWEEEYRPRVRIVKPEQIKIRVGDLTPGDFISIMDEGNMSEKMKTLFMRAYESLKKDEKRLTRSFTKNELRETIEGLSDGTNEPSIAGLLWRYDRMVREKIFDDYRSIPLREYFQPGLLTIMDVSGIGEWKQQWIATILLRQLFDAREGTDNERYSEERRPERYLPHPVFVILEEAHRFAPQTGDAKSRQILKKILSEGRKFGIGVCMVSQRPSKLDADALSQCMTQVTMRIINPSDQKQIGESIESVSRDLLDELPALARGQAITSGVAINTPIIVEIRERRTTQIRGTSKDAPRVWREQMQDERSETIETRPSYELDVGV
ncbi:MAG TPA: ATP-binding protein [Candidatus Methanoperedenaceae archaeon]|nr:ATP-binding protein [Candidatus Methanoperedenaceae archaeon]